MVPSRRAYAGCRLATAYNAALQGLAAPLLRNSAYGAEGRPYFEITSAHARIVQVQAVRQPQASCSTKPYQAAKTDAVDQ